MIVPYTVLVISIDNSDMRTAQCMFKKYKRARYIFITMKHIS